MGTALAALVAVWLIAQGTTGRLAARLLSWREARPGELAPPDTASPSSGAGAGPPAAVPQTGVLSIDQIAALALSRLPRDQAIVATAIAMRESGGHTDAHNAVYPDDSWGLWQINRLAWAQFPATQLATAQGNLEAMLVVSSGGTNWHPWQIGGDPLRNTDVAAATAAVTRAGG